MFKHFLRRALVLVEAMHHYLKVGLVGRFLHLIFLPLIINSAFLLNSADRCCGSLLLLSVPLRRKQTVGFGAVLCKNNRLLRSQTCVLSMLLISFHIYFEMIGFEKQYTSIDFMQPLSSNFGARTDHYFRTLLSCST